MDWDKLRIFHTVAMSGSFTHAGDKLGLSQSAISRQIRGLEESLDVSLFNRHARGLSLTDEGETLFRTADEVVSKIQQTEQFLIDGHEMPRGELKITTTMAFGSTWLMNHIKPFIEKYPELSVQILLSDKDLDLTTREADIAIRFHSSNQLDMIQKKIGLFHQHLYASPEYISRMGKPASPEDLDNHDMISFGDFSSSPFTNIDWHLKLGSQLPRKSVLRVNNVHAVLQAVKAGVGIAALPDYLVQTSMNVVRVMEDHQGEEFPAYAQYTPEQRNSKKVIAFRDFIIENFRGERF